MRGFSIKMIACSCLFIGFIFAQENTEKAEESCKHSIDFSPVSPFINIYGLNYNRRLGAADEIIFGLAWMQIHYDFGHTNSPALIFGYRRFLWNKLHLEYQLWPAYDNFYEKTEDRYYESFDIWNEFRLGYQFDFELDQNVFSYL